MTTEETKVTAVVPRIYVASLADYNNGRLVGKWIDAIQDADAIFAEIREMLGQSKEMIAEEWAIHDYENFGDLGIDESSDIESVAEAAQLIVEHGPVFAALLNHFGGLAGITDAKRYMEDGCHGAWDSLEDYARELVEDCYADVLEKLPDFIRYHIDYEGIAHDMELNGDVFTVEYDGKVHVFDTTI